MGFEPLDPKELERYKPPCQDGEHDPPSHYVVTSPTAWVCPSCGRRVVLTPRLSW